MAVTKADTRTAVTAMRQVQKKAQLAALKLSGLPRSRAYALALNIEARAGQVLALIDHAEPEVEVVADAAEPSEADRCAMSAATPAASPTT